MSRVEPNRNVYVGHRYVPKIFGEWDQQNEYEGLSIVTHQGTSYTSKKRVPVGIDILNEEYWVVTGNYNAQVEYYRDEVRELGGTVTNVISDVSELQSDVTGLETDLSGLQSDVTDLETDLNKDISDTNVNLTNLTDRVDSIAVNVDTFINPADAVQFAYNNDMVLDWGSKDYVINDNIKNFHDVKHIGYGSITTDGNTYYLNPQNIQTNKLYVSSNGSDANTGFSFSKGLASLQRAFNILRGRTEVLGGKWEIHISPGTFGGARLMGVESLHQLQVIGSVDINNEPTTKLSGTISGGTGGNFGIRVEPGIKDFKVDNISFEDFDNTGTNYGFLMKSGGKTIINNCRAKNCSFGFACVNSGVMIASSCIAENCSTGYSVSYGGSGTFGAQNALFGSGGGSKALNCTTGISVTRNAVAHADFMEIEDCTFAGIDVNMSSRVNVLGSHFKRNRIGVFAHGSAEWINNTNYKNHFYENSPDENDTNYGHFGVSRETRLYAQSSTNEFRTFVSTPEFSLTGTTQRTTAVVVPSNLQIPEYFLKYEGRKIIVKVTGSYQGTGGDKTITVSMQNISPSGGTAMGNDTIDSFAYPTDSEHRRPFVFNLELVTMGDDNAVMTAERNVHLAGLTYCQSLIRSLSDTSLKKQLRITAELESPADTINIDKVEMYVAG